MRHHLFFLVTFISIAVGRTQYSDEQLQPVPYTSSGEVLTPEARVPDVLLPWIDWALWGQKDRDALPIYSDASRRVAFWPSELEFVAEETGAVFALNVVVASEAWVPLPVGEKVWPQNVTVNDVVAPVVIHGGRPCIKLDAGTYKIAGAFVWAAMPQWMTVPPEIGILRLTVAGNPIEQSAWGADGRLWLRRDVVATTEMVPDFLETKFYGLLRDGIPVWFDIRIELSVAGKSREENLGVVLPQGWRLASVKSPLPFAMDDAGRAKAQVRAGKWMIDLTVFRLDNPFSLAFAPDSRPAEEMLVGFSANPSFRAIEFQGVGTVDVTQTTYPQEWRQFPVYFWNTAEPLKWEEQMRGMGERAPVGLRIQRRWWLDEKGTSFTVADNIQGASQTLWRLDAAPNLELGSAKIGGEQQLITLNARTDASGVEVRTRDIVLDATARMKNASPLPASGWQANVDNLSITMHLPPGWRLFALFGADSVRGDWLTAWTLRGIFLVLIFVLAVMKLWGWRAAALALLVSALIYHEPGGWMPPWLLLIVPLALLRVVPQGKLATAVRVFKWLCVALLVLVFVPFINQQIKQALYPQLQSSGVGASAISYVGSGMAAPMSVSMASEADFAVAEDAEVPRAESAMRVRSSADFSKGSEKQFSKKDASNMRYDFKARMQTGPALPTWSGRTVSCSWNGPVTEEHVIRPIFIPCWLERILSLMRIVLPILLVWTLLRSRPQQPAAVV